MIDLFKQHGLIILAALLLVSALPVEIATVTEQSLSVVIEEEGRTRLIDRFQISAPVEGLASRITLEVGDRVTKGGRLLDIVPLPSAVLDPRSRARAEAEVAAAKAALASAQAQVRAAAADASLAAAERQRIETLRVRQLVSAETADMAVAEATRAEAALRSAEFTVTMAQYNLAARRTALDFSTGEVIDAGDQVKIGSPITGQVMQIHHPCEGPVKVGQPLLELGDATHLEIEVDVLSHDAVRIRPGMQVRIQRWGGEAPLQGRVRLIEPVGFTKVSALGVEEQRVLVISDFTSPAVEWRRLGDGYRIEAQFVLWQAEQVLQVPMSTLFRQADQWAVFIADDGKAQIQTVELGHRNGLQAQVLSGLKLGDKIINHPDDTIEAGRSIRPRD